MKDLGELPLQGAKESLDQSRIVVMKRVFPCKSLKEIPVHHRSSVVVHATGELLQLGCRITEVLQHV